MLVGAASVLVILSPPGRKKNLSCTKSEEKAQSSRTLARRSLRIRAWGESRTHPGQGGTIRTTWPMSWQPGMQRWAWPPALRRQRGPAFGVRFPRAQAQLRSRLPSMNLNLSLSPCKNVHMYSLKKLVFYWTFCTGPFCTLYLIGFFPASASFLSKASLFCFVRAGKTK